MNDYDGIWAWKRIALVSIILLVIVFSLYLVFLHPRDIKPTTKKCDPFPDRVEGFTCEDIKVEYNCHDVCPLTRGYQIDRFTREYQAGNVEYLTDSIYRVQYYSPDKTRELILVLAKFQGSEDSNMCYEELFNITKICYEELFNIKEMHPEKFFGEDLSSEELLSLCMQHRDIQGFLELSLNNNRGFFFEMREVNADNRASTYRILSYIDGSDVFLLINNGYSDKDLMDINKLKDLILQFKVYGEKLR